MRRHAALIASAFALAACNRAPAPTDALPETAPIAESQTPATTTMATPATTSLPEASTTPVQPEPMPGLHLAGGTAFNGINILGTGAGAFRFQVGANTTTNDSIDITTTDLTADATITAVAGTDNTGAGRAVIDNTADATTIQGVIDNIDVALDTVNSQRAVMGASQSRFESVISNLQISVENQSAAKSRIMDTDFAAETANLSRAQILQQAGNAMVAQANQLPQQVLSLLR